MSDLMTPLQRVVMKDRQKVYNYKHIIDDTFNPDRECNLKKVLKLLKSLFKKGEYDRTKRS